MNSGSDLLEDDVVDVGQRDSDALKQDVEDLRDRGWTATAAGHRETNMNLWKIRFLLYFLIIHLFVIFPEV